jgi:hypothetical protein
MRYRIILSSMLLCAALTANAQVSVGIAVPGVSIGINVPVYPTLVRVPDTPVYYAPQQDSNYFFYDGLYWVYQGDNWYSSGWYNGPWGFVSPNEVPLYVLRVPVRYYRDSPTYFRGWRADAPPRWGDHWGHDWQERRRGWDRWNRAAVPPPAPLPTYQRKFPHSRYPEAQQQQQDLRSQNYRYQPRDRDVRRQYQQQRDASPHQPQRGPNAQPPGGRDGRDGRDPRQQGGNSRDRDRGDDRGEDRDKRGQDRGR